MVGLSVLPFSRREKAIVEGIQQHLSMVRSTVNELFKMIQVLAEGKTVDAAEALGRVLDKESEADTLQRALSTKIAEGAFFGGVREDILNLIEKIDNIADSAKDASRLLSIGVLRDSSGLTLLGSANMQEFLHALDDAISALSNLIQAFQINKKAMLSRIHDVEQYEELADTKKDLLLRQLFTNSAGSDPVTLIQLRDFLFTADDIADNAEDASDVILVLVAKGYG